MKRFIFCILSLIFAIAAFAGCNSRQQPIKPEFPSYENDKVMYLGIFSSPAPSEEAYQICADAGFNVMLLDHNYGAPGSEEFLKLFEYCEKAGVKALPMRIDQPMSALYSPDLSQYAAFDGIYVWDEPSEENFEEIASWIPEFERRYPGKKFVVNLFPSFAEHPEGYVSYINGFVDTVLNHVSGYKQLSIDHYPLTVSARGNTISDTWLYDLETVAQAAKGTDIETHLYLQTIEHLNFRKLTSPADVRFQYSVGMAYGFSAFSAFTYPTQGSDWGEGLVTQVNKGGEWVTQKNPGYFFIQTVNRELLNFDHVYLSFDYLGTMPVEGETKGIGSTACFAFLEHADTALTGIESVTAEQDLLVGAFEDENKVKAYMFTNFTEPSEGKTNKTEIVFEEAVRARVYRNGVSTDIDLTEHALQLDLQPGEGAFVIVV